MELSKGFIIIISVRKFTEFQTNHTEFQTNKPQISLLIQSQDFYKNPDPKCLPSKVYYHYGRKCKNDLCTGLEHRQVKMQFLLNIKR